MEDESLKKAIEEKLYLVDHNPEWLLRFTKECERLRALLKGASCKIRHVGSTAIPGLKAKPVVDIIVGFESLEVADALIPRLLDGGYVTSDEFNSTLPDRRWLMKHKDGKRLFHLHLVVQNSPIWNEYVGFTTILQDNPTARDEYQQLKEELVATSDGDRDAYTSSKRAFILRWLNSASISVSE